MRGSKHLVCTDTSLFYLLWEAAAIGRAWELNKNAETPAVPACPQSCGIRICIFNQSPR